MRFLCLFLSVVFVGAVFAPVAQAGRIAAVVNEDVITESDFNSRMKMILVSSGLPDTADIRLKLRGQVMGTLIDEQLMFQEAGRLDLKAEPQEIQKGFALLAAQNKFEPAQFKAALIKSGIAFSTMERQISAQIVWTKVVQKKIHPRLSVSESDVDDYLARLAANVGKTEYLASEIFLPVESRKDDAQVRQLAQNIVEDLRLRGAPFAQIAQQLSKAAGAQNGGSLGWVQEDQLAREMRGVLQSLEKGQVSDPVRSPQGYHIMWLRDMREIAEATLPTREAVHNMLLTQRAERMQRRHLLDLKSAAFIEDRGRARGS